MGKLKMNNTISEFLENGYSRSPSLVCIEEDTWICGIDDNRPDDEKELGEAICKYFGNESKQTIENAKRLFDLLISLPEDYTLKDAAEFVRRKDELVHDVCVIEGASQENNFNSCPN